MKKLHELPKDMLIQLLINVNNLSSLTYEELEDRERNISLEKIRRNNVTMCNVIKNSLLQLKSFPHLRQFVEENTDMINSIEFVSSVNHPPHIKIKGIDYCLNSTFPFSTTLSNLYIKPGWENSLFADIKRYIETGDFSGSRWLNTTKIEYNLCEICNKKEILFHYENAKNIRIVIDAQDASNYITDVERIVKCSVCERTHCIDHIC